MNIFLKITLITMLFCAGCNLTGGKNSNVPDFNTGKDVSQSREIIDKSTENINKATNKIGEETKSIKTETDQTRRKVPDEAKEEINPHLNSIEASSNTISEKTQEINSSVAELSGAKSLLENAEIKISTLEDTVETLAKERDVAVKEKNKAVEDSKSQLHKALRWVIVGCIILAGVFAVLFIMHGSKFGLTGAAICAVVCAMAIFVESYFIYIAIAGGVLLLGLVGALIYQVVIRNRAFREVVDTVEVAQTQMSEEAREKIFGAAGETGVMNTIQSPSTMDLVKKEKAKLGTLWSYAKRETEKKSGKED